MNYKLFSNNCELQIYAQGDLNSKTGILFLHGGPGSGAKAIMELPVFQSFHQDYCCIYFDQRGSGESLYNLQKGLSIQLITDDVSLVVNDMKKRFNLDKVVLFGCSFGGCLACLSIEQGVLVDKVILSSPAILFSRRQAIELFDGMKENYTSRVSSQFKKVLSSFEGKPELFFKDDLISNYIYSKLNPSNSLRHTAAMSDWFFKHFFTDVIRNIKIPTLILQGEDDKICIAKNIVDVIHEAQNPNIEFQLYSNCGHAVFEDKEQEFITESKKFIKEELTC
jgi:pimeloyl-ACP methyl ester carboxylesterase